MVLDSDWQVWPIFAVELIAFLLLFFPARCRFLGMKMQSWVVVILLMVNVGIIFSLMHDSTEILNLHF